MNHERPAALNINNRSYSSSHLPQTPLEQQQFDHELLQRQQYYIQQQQQQEQQQQQHQQHQQQQQQLQQQLQQQHQQQQHQQQFERSQALQHTQTFPTTPKQARTVPSAIYTGHPGSFNAFQIQSPGFAPQVPLFAAPPKTPTGQPLPTSTFIPNLNYPQAGFAARPLSAGGPLHSKAYDNQQFFIPQNYPPVPRVQDIHVFNSGTNEKNIIQANKEMMSQQQAPQYQMESLQQAQQMHFDPPPTQAMEEPPAQQEPMAYDQGYALNSNGQPHAPGQISHPNQLFGAQTYKNGLCGGFGDMGSCCLGCWCPCMLYSKTHHRLKTLPNSNVDGYSNCNAHCCMFCVASPVSWIFTMIQRTRIRDLYQIKGSPVSDCAKAYYCPCCVLIQDEREIRDREEEKRRCAGPGSGVVGEQGYKKPEKMAYQRSSVIG